MRIIIVLLFALSLCVFTQEASAFIWTPYGDTNFGSPESLSGITVGFSSVNAADTDTQAAQISGAGTLLSGYSALTLAFHADLNTWDAYNGSLPEDDGGGFFDVFAVVLSEQDYYWNLADTDTHPLEDNPVLILTSPDPRNAYWGGQNSLDGILESDNSDVTLTFNINPAKQYYLSMFLQTRDFFGLEQFPSWGTISNFQILQSNAIPEPVSCVLLSIGLLGYGLGRRRTKADIR